jgi:sec-independent protein translocase protein TatA
MIAGLTGLHLIIIVAVIALIFGGAKLPMFAKNLGQSAKILRREISTMRDDDPDAVAAPVADSAPAVDPVPAVRAVANDQRS